MTESQIHNLGAFLAETREDKRFSVDDVCHQLKLQESIVRSIEANDYQSLPAAAFVRGYLRSYALLLELDPELIISEYNRMAPADPALISIGDEKARSASPQLVFWGTLVVGGVLLSLLLIWIATRANLSATAEAEPELEPPNTPQAFVAEEARQMAQISDEAEASPVEVETSAHNSEPEIPDIKSVVVEESSALTQEAVEIEDATAGSSEPEPESIEEVSLNSEIPDVTPIAPAGTDRLALLASDDSWIEVKDSNGFTLIYEMLEASEESIVLQGQAPFELVLGNARNVSIYVNGTLYDHARYIRNNDSARFKVAAP